MTNRDCNSLLLFNSLIRLKGRRLIIRITLESTLLVKNFCKNLWVFFASFVILKFLPKEFLRKWMLFTEWEDEIVCILRFALLAVRGHGLFVGQRKRLQMLDPVKETNYPRYDMVRLCLKNLNLNVQGVDDLQLTLSILISLQNAMWKFSMMIILGWFQWWPKTKFRCRNICEGSFLMTGRSKSISRLLTEYLSF